MIPSLVIVESTLIQMSSLMFAASLGRWLRRLHYMKPVFLLC